MSPRFQETTEPQEGEDIPSAAKGKEGDVGHAGGVSQGFQPGPRSR
jgi:hypothetical protein